MTRKETLQSFNLPDLLNDASIDRVSAVDVDWNIIAWNKTSETVTGVRKRDILGRPILEVFPQLTQDAEITAAIRSGLQGHKSFLPSIPGSFNREFYENHFIPLTDEHGEIHGVMNIMHDVSHRIKAERQLQKLNAALGEKYRQLENANAELATFTSITGNDLKEPVKKVYLSLELIMKNDGMRLSDSSKASLRRMQASLNRMNLLLDDILTLSRASSFSQDFTSVNLDQVLKDVLFSLREKIREKQASIDVKPLPVVTGSGQMLHYLFYNLLDNAVKFQPEHPQPRIQVAVTRLSGTDPGRSGREEREDGEEKEYLCISVKDNGIGFDPQEAEKIFLMFERLHPRGRFTGSGIGLTICRKVMEAHGGYIEAESHPGRGAAFHCYFPLPAGK